LRRSGFADVMDCNRGTEIHQMLGN